MEKHKRIFIAGAGSAAWWNAGDEAILSAMLSDLRAEIPEAQFCVLSANPPGALKQYEVEEISVEDIERIIQAARESDLLVLGGGGLFYDYWGFNVEDLLTSSHTGHGVFVDFALLATLLNKPLMIYAVGVGPLVSETGRTFTKLVFEQAGQITVRDSASKELMASLGIPPEQMRVTADPVFGAQEVSLDAGRQRIQEKVSLPLPSPVVGVVLRTWEISGVSQQDWEAAVAQALDKFMEQYGGIAFFVPFHKKIDQVDDSLTSSRVRSLMKHGDQAILFEDTLSLDEKVSILRHCDLILGMRLHSLIHAVQYGIPMVGLAYDPKITQLFTSLQQTEYVFDLPELDGDHLFLGMQKSYQNRSILSDFYARQAGKLALAAKENAILAARLLDTGLQSISASADLTVEIIKRSLVEQSLRFYVKVKALHEQVVQNQQGIADRNQLILEKDQNLAGLRQEVTNAMQQLADKDQRIADLRQEVTSATQLLAEKDQMIIDLRHTAASATQTLNEFQASWGGRLVKVLQVLRMRVAPPGTLRSRILVAFFKGLLDIYRKVRPAAQPVGNQPGVPDFINRYVSSPSGTRVLLITRIFFNPRGNDMQFGGAERYLLELANLIREAGYEPVIIQLGNEYWMRYYGTQPVVAIQVGYEYDTFMTELEKHNPQGVLAIYSPFELASTKIQIPSIGISHGIYWDEEIYHRSQEEMLATVSRLNDRIEAVNTLISVDTNTINWLRTISLTAAQKALYIPNFVDLEQFNLPPVKTDRQRLTILFPRRLVFQRGFWLVHKILPAILEKYSHVDFHFVGKGGPEEQQAMTELTQKYPQRVHWYFLPPEEMQTAYQKADITLIPTTLSEGTSLSCLEAMAMGNAVIATNVGGLPDLILDGYNGLLIEPSAEALQKAIERLIDDNELRQTLQKRGQEVVKAFAIQNWREKWRSALSQYLPEQSHQIRPARLRFIIFPYSWGLHWHGVQQRPHHLAVQFSRSGFESYWYTPEGRQEDPLPGIHLVSQTDELYVNRPVIFVYYPHSYREIGRFKNPIVVYDVLDDISIYEASGSDSKTAQEGREFHERLLETADIVLASSRILFEQVAQRRPDVIYLPNGVDVEHFHSNNYKPGPLIRNDNRPLIGYHGAVASWFDAGLVAKVAELRPDYDFVIIGPVSDPKAEAELRSCSNIRLLGAMPYEDLPAYVAQFDASIMPFVLSKLTHAVRPLKILEYLSMGKPVVSTPIHEILDWPGVSFGETAESFAEKLDLALKNGLEDKETVEAFVMESAWERVIQPLLKALDAKETQVKLKQ